jgi:8-oxo-dGTP pyrophosphatase MutT (NUDIX family)
MSEVIIARPSVTVATIVQRGGRFLLVEEETRAGRKLNQPAGHLESGESLPAAAVRETLEETAWAVTPTALVGVYRWEAADNGATFVRFTFCAEAREHDPLRVLDIGIVQAVWLTYDEVVARRRDHRSPLVQRCIDDYRAGARWPLDFVKEVAVQRGFWEDPEA